MEVPNDLELSNKQKSNQMQIPLLNYIIHCFDFISETSFAIPVNKWKNITSLRLCVYVPNSAKIDATPP